MSKSFKDRPAFIDVENQPVILPVAGNKKCVRVSAGSMVKELIALAGDDPNREGLKETPKRYLKALEFYTSGYRTDPKAILKTFHDGAENYDEMVLLTDIPVWSLCEHHLAPFFGVAHIAYIPCTKVVGLSKLARFTDAYARRFQVQERLTRQICDGIQEILKPRGVGVVLKCRHTCMEARGVCKAGIHTTTSALAGVFRKAAVRQEFLRLANANGK